MIIAIPIIYLLLTAILLWVCICCKGYWWLKLILIAFSTCFCISLTLSLQSLTGWPSSNGLPNRFEIYWIKVKEPSTTHSDDGAIYLWTQNLTPKKNPWWSLYQPDNSEPRVYKIDYSREQHKQANQALGMLKKGERVIGINGKGGGVKGKGSGKSRGKFGKFFGHPGEAFRGHKRLFFYKMPPPKLPSKGKRI